MPRGSRQRVARGIFRDTIGLAGVVKVDGTQHERRFPAGTDLATIEKWRRNTVSRIDLDLALPSSTTPATLAQDIATFLALLPEGDYKRDTAILLRHWRMAMGDEPRTVLTSVRVQQQMMAWARDGAAAVTINHRRRALATLWNVLDGKAAANPTRDVAKLTAPRREPKGLPWPVVLHILSHTQPNVSGDRLRVLGHTGWPAAILMRVKASDLHLTGSQAYAQVRPRRKGKGVPAVAYPLTPPAAKALRALVKRRGLGPFSTSSLRKSFLVALKHAKVAWPGTVWPVPADASPYTLRHSFLTRVYALSRDLRATQELALHADIKTTAIYTEAAVSTTASATRDLLAATSAAGTKAGTRRRSAKQRLKL